ncbi:MAG: hypothetical protein M3256_10630 [Actinomycetota bacterium]|nr:hypothetical protein [Actinomycetota bacterium]
MANGVVNCTTEQEIQYVERALRFTTKSVMAVAARGQDWWAKPEADVYWTVYGNAAQRLNIRRVFLVQGALNDSVKKVLDRLVSLDMETFWTPIEHVPVRLRMPIVLFDGKLLHRTSSSQQVGTDHADFTDSSRQIEQAQEQLNAIFELPTTQKWLGGERR